MPHAVAGLAAELADRHGGVDIVMSNAIAALSRDRPQSEQADASIDVANGGTHAVLRSFGPVLRPGGRLIVVASSLGTLGHLDPCLHPLFDGATLEQVEAAVESWAERHSRRHGRGPGVAPLDQRALQGGSGRCGPGGCRAAPGGRSRRGNPRRERCALDWWTPGRPGQRTGDFSRAQTPEQAARALLDLILADRLDPATYGELVQFGQVVPWHSGTPSHQPGLRCSAGRTGAKGTSSVPGLSELPAFLRSIYAAAGAAGDSGADGAERKPTGRQVISGRRNRACAPPANAANAADGANQAGPAGRAAGRADAITERLARTPRASTRTAVRRVSHSSLDDRGRDAELGFLRGKQGVVTVQATADDAIHRLRQ